MALLRASLAGRFVVSPYLRRELASPSPPPLPITVLVEVAAGVAGRNRDELVPPLFFLPVLIDVNALPRNMIATTSSSSSNRSRECHRDARIYCDDDDDDPAKPAATMSPPPSPRDEEEGDVAATTSTTLSTRCCDYLRVIWSWRNTWKFRIALFVLVTILIIVGVGVKAKRDQDRLDEYWEYMNRVSYAMVRYGPDWLSHVSRDKEMMHKRAINDDDSNDDDEDMMMSSNVTKTTDTTTTTDEIMAESTRALFRLMDDAAMARRNKRRIAEDNESETNNNNDNNDDDAYVGRFRRSNIYTVRMIRANLVWLMTFAQMIIAIVMYYALLLCDPGYTGDTARVIAANFVAAFAMFVTCYTTNRPVVVQQ